MQYETYAKMRDKKGYKDSQVAAGTGIGKSTFSDWKKGNYTPKADKLMKIANFLNIPMNTFLCIDELEISYRAAKILEAMKSPQEKLAERILALPADKRKSLEEYLCFLEQK